MAKADIKVMGEGGVHAHLLASPEKTILDGMHKHLFYVADRLILTDLDGEHWHPVTPRTSVIGEESSPSHTHKVSIATENGPVELETSDGTTHSHELQSTMTTLSGLHTHTLDLAGQTVVSLLPGDLIDELNAAAKSMPGFEGFNLEKGIGEPLEMNFGLIKKLNSPKFSALVRKATLSLTFKNLARLSDGMKIHALILSKERFSDIGTARRFALDHSLDVRASEDRDQVFRFLVLSEERFQQATLQRVKISDGVEAVVGFLTEEARLTESLEVKPEASLPENAQRLEATQQTATASLNSVEDKVQQDLDLKSLNKKLADAKMLYGTDAAQPSVRPFEYTILKQETEKRLVTGPLLVPEKIDLQNEIVSKEEIESAAHNYMTKLTFQKDPDFLKSIGLDPRAQQGFMHVDFSRKLAIVESYLAPVDFTLNKRDVAAGTWMITMKVFDDEVWALIKTRKIRGFSIGGRANLIEETSTGKSIVISPDFNNIHWKAA